MRWLLTLAARLFGRLVLLWLERATDAAARAAEVQRQEKERATREHVDARLSGDLLRVRNAELMLDDATFRLRQLESEHAAAREKEAEQARAIGRELRRRTVGKRLDDLGA